MIFPKLITDNYFFYMITLFAFCVCNRYLPERFTNPGMAVMEIDIPSGFTADLESSNTRLDNTKRREIRDDKTVVLYYDQVGYNLMFTLYYLPTYFMACLI